MKIFLIKILKRILFPLILGYFLFLFCWIWVAGPQTVWRIISYDTSSIEDHRLFPARNLNASTSPFYFTEGLDDDLNSSIINIDNDEKTLEKFLEESNTTAFLVIKEDVMVMEKYFQGYTQDTPTLAFSMSKSFLSILIGMAVDEGIIESIDQAVTEYVPELAKAGYDHVTLRHLLQMTSGMDYIEVEGRDTSLHNRFYYTTRLEDELLKLDLDKDPGKEFSYKSGENALLGLILSRAIAPKTITSFVQERLWQPLGMEYGGAWNLDSDDGLEKTWCCLSATARDYAKLGRLMLHQGNWQGEELLSKDWVEQSTQVDISNGSIWNYQYQWWLVSNEGDFTAMGHLGQFVYIHPEDNLVIVRLGTSRGGLEWDEWQKIFSTLANEIE